ncbi:hypothetical protein CLAFUW4_13541 [Fulvia fulva]|uniref:Uncharacterized protein n=1 Tax=Passalora fulva TaxID=5499 RepID=A0A9Q8PLF6_PASFU|nr:uncharacterized protein CLAFUR5_13392 [Fulvia fulva]KAK4610389.1 hypothetical protein CLAFUR4_13543 [Fulvia fulva]KAK4611239.1 hypothetical protein CLAFUR0_13552 [Fulvia fulva]UJO24696.1 hypothetical protein CLAFUR5_13392 [Fulvia fulva]WPV22243.1 hypothetical protein CLAFUW4_13541 [Fulvia fulva]WPV36894.1 hypothetical protein CLAFUW7_13548 [Fulvia fulva]
MADSATILGYVSLVIAIIAFFLSVIQAFQQYISTAEGYRKCAESVMGPWVKHRRRHFVLEELRFAVAFKTPVLFVAKPTNDRGPVPGAVIRNVEGTDKSKELTLSWNPVNTTKEKDDSGSGSFFTRVHTTNDERASWVTLLAMLQKNEADTRLWDKETRESAPPRGGLKPVKPPEYSMCVQLQGRDRNWDFMPESVLRPYATSALTHIAEMAMMLGLSWVVFDPAEGNLRAEGNGFALTSSTVQSLGIVISFVQTGPNFTAAYKPNRVIPNAAVKDIMFGTVPSIFDVPPSSSSSSQAPTWTYRLTLGDERSIRKTLKYVHCKSQTVTRFLQTSSDQTLGRSINFDLIAMLGRTFRLRGSNFKKLPNPTYHGAWIDTFNACALMREFQSQLIALPGPPSPQVLYIETVWLEKLEPVWADEESEIDITMREAAHDVIEQCDRFLTGKECGETAVIPVVTAHITTLLDQLLPTDSALSQLEADDEAQLMSLYFNVLRPAVAEHAKRQDTNFPLSASVHNAEPDLLIGAGEKDGDGDVGKDGRVSEEEIWVMLQFRACLWWCLHEFDDSAAKVLDPRWMGSRLPVMIL